MTVVVRPIDEKLYEKLAIELGSPEALRTNKGTVIFPASVKRASAWICAWCGETPYEDPVNSKSELLGLDEKEMLDDPDIDPIPLILFIDVVGDGIPEKEVTFHFHCAKDLDIILERT